MKTLAQYYYLVQAQSGNEFSGKTLYEYTHEYVVAYHTSKVKSSSTGSLATGDTFYVSMYINITALVFSPPIIQC